MKKFKLHQLLTVFLAFLVLSGSAGITLNAHYCKTEKSLEKSLFPFPIDCTHESTACDHEQEKAIADNCCTTTHNKSVNEEKSCCEDFLQYLKGISDFELPKLQIKSLFNTFLTFVVRLLDVFSPSVEKAKQTASYSTDVEPPAASGKMRVITFQQLKLDGQLIA